MLAATAASNQFSWKTLKIKLLVLINNEQVWEVDTLSGN